MLKKIIIKINNKKRYKKTRRQQIMNKWRVKIT